MGAFSEFKLFKEGGFPRQENYGGCVAIIMKSARDRWDREIAAGVGL